LSKKDNTSGGIFLLVLFLIFVKVIAKYLVTIAIGIGIIFALAILVWLINFVLKRRKIHKVRQSEVISIPSQTLYSIPMRVEKHEYETDEGKIKSRWMVASLRPELNNSNVSFVPMDYALKKVKVLRSGPQQDNNYQTTKEIASLTKEIFTEIDPQLSKFKQEHAELARLEKLVSSSEMYHSKTHLYRRARIQVQQLIDQAEKLKREYVKCIREILIGAEMSQFNPDSLSDILERKLILHSKYETFKTEFQNKKDEIQVYDNLDFEMSQIP